MTQPHGGSVQKGAERGSEKRARQARAASPFEPRFINRAPASFGRKAARSLREPPLSAVFHPDFRPGFGHRTILRTRGFHSVREYVREYGLPTRAGLLTAIDIIIALPSLPTAAAFMRPRAFGNGLRKPRSPAVTFSDLVSLIGLRVGDGFPGTESAVSRVSERGRRMKGPVISSVETLTLDEALSYMDIAMGDELAAAFELARDRNLLDGGTSEPDDTEVHHALFMLRRARGLAAPSFDSMRVQLRRLLPAA